MVDNNKYLAMIVFTIILVVLFSFLATYTAQTAESNDLKLSTQLNNATTKTIISNPDGNNITNTIDSIDNVTAYNDTWLDFVLNSTSGIQVPNKAAYNNFNETNNFTISLWASPNSTNWTNDNSNLAYFLAKSDIILLRSRTDNGTIEFEVRNNSNQVDTISTTAREWNTTDWYHIVGMLNSSELSIFINGVRESNTTVMGGSLHYDAFNPLILANSLNANAGLNGSFDNIVIFNRSLTETEVEQLYNQSRRANLSLFSDNIVSYWAANENNGTVLHDLGGTSNGTFVRNVTWMNDGVDVPLSSSDYSFSGAIFTTDNSNFYYSNLTVNYRYIVSSIQETLVTTTTRSTLRIVAGLVTLALLGFVLMGVFYWFRDSNFRGNVR